jgi:hypothetical protein
MREKMERHKQRQGEKEGKEWKKFPLSTHIPYLFLLKPIS